MRILDSKFPVESKDMDIWVDAEYEVPTCEDLERIITACPSDRYQYVKDSRDCDDFVRIFLGWLSQEGRGNLSIGWVRGWLQSPTDKVYHAMCWALTQEALWLFEPQNNRYKWKWGEPVNHPEFSEFIPNRMGI
jgi:hypothetical protein